MVDIALLHSRRKQNQSTQDHEQEKEDNNPNTNKKQNQPILENEQQKEENSPNTNKKNHPKQEREQKGEENKPNSNVYICATMWHENRVEMKQILISIFRFVILFGVFRPTGEFLLIWRRHQYR